MATPQHTVRVCCMGKRKETPTDKVTDNTCLIKRYGANETLVKWYTDKQMPANIRMKSNSGFLRHWAITANKQETIRLISDPADDNIYWQEPAQLMNRDNAGNC